MPPPTSAATRPIRPAVNRGERRHHQLGGAARPAPSARPRSRAAALRRRPSRFRRGDSASTRSDEDVHPRAETDQHADQGEDRAACEASDPAARPRQGTAGSRRPAGTRPPRWSNPRRNRGFQSSRPVPWPFGRRKYSPCEIRRKAACLAASASHRSVRKVALAARSPRPTSRGGTYERARRSAANAKAPPSDRRAIAVALLWRHHAVPAWRNATRFHRRRAHVSSSGVAPRRCGCARIRVQRLAPDRASAASVARVTGATRPRRCGALRRWRRRDPQRNGVASGWRGCATSYLPAGSSGSLTQAPSAG